MKELSLEQKVQRVLDYMEIQNVIAKHVYYYGDQKQWEELDTIWAKKVPDVAYAHNADAYVGMEIIKLYYGRDNEAMRREKLAMISRLFPDIKNKPENEGIGDLNVHPITTPFIEIAGDGKTAKGIWYSTSLCAEIQKDGKLLPMSIWGKYGVDFIKEDGKWKIWHFRVYNDFMVPEGEGWEQNLNNFPGRTFKGAATPNKQLKPYNFYSPKTVPQYEPKPSEPYETWNDSMSYIK